MLIIHVLILIHLIPMPDKVKTHLSLIIPYAGQLVNRYTTPTNKLYSDVINDDVTLILIIFSIQFPRTYPARNAALY